MLHSNLLFYGKYLLILIILTLIIIANVNVLRSLRQYILPHTRGNRRLLQVWRPMSFPTQGVYMGASDVEVTEGWSTKVSTVVKYDDIESITILELSYSPFQLLANYTRFDLKLLCKKQTPVILYNLSEKQVADFIANVKIIQQNVVIERNPEKVYPSLLQGVRYRNVD